MFGCQQHSASDIESHREKENEQQNAQARRDKLDRARVHTHWFKLNRMKSVTEALRLRRGRRRAVNIERARKCHRKKKCLANVYVYVWLSVCDMCVSVYLAKLLPCSGDNSGDARHHHHYLLNKRSKQGRETEKERSNRGENNKMATHTRQCAHYKAWGLSCVRYGYDDAISCR